MMTETLVPPRSSNEEAQVIRDSLEHSRECIYPRTSLFHHSTLNDEKLRQIKLQASVTRVCTWEHTPANALLQYHHHHPHPVDASSPTAAGLLTNNVNVRRIHGRALMSTIFDIIDVYAQSLSLGT